MKLNNIRQLEIAKSKFGISRKCNEKLDYDKWIDFIDRNDFIWEENTEKGKETILNIDLIPESFRDRVLKSLNKKTACIHSGKTDDYSIFVTFYDEWNYIVITIAEKLLFSDLKIFLEMAKYLDALLLKDGDVIIDEKVIEKLK